ncbi:MAG: hypothetical protein GAK33_03888 [Burkholderia lata]|uniref:Uncharacterized protein n=1 Tax=Burkholderia lata (strain ATCC 17760 / DSM 23089 / LMG 22485 / NCIMB 9086 / R18194 / 383) TaxID=482957 RepID=A0A833UKP4_BURL3|nr:MAG: hypothetical protein GAK33_03888 [Burkholderia lata]
MNGHGNSAGITQEEEPRWDRGSVQDSYFVVSPPPAAATGSNTITRSPL